MLRKLPKPIVKAAMISVLAARLMPWRGWLSLVLTAVLVPYGLAALLTFIMLQAGAELSRFEDHASAGFLALYAAATIVSSLWGSADLKAALTPKDGEPTGTLAQWILFSVFALCGVVLILYAQGLGRFADELFQEHKAGGGQSYLTYDALRAVLACWAIAMAYKIKIFWDAGALAVRKVPKPAPVP